MWREAMTPTGYKVPRKAQQEGRFEVVWKYLETVEEYESLEKLRALLVTKFEGAATPSLSTLHRHFKTNRGNKS
jgi:hypothetical protein